MNRCRLLLFHLQIQVLLLLQLLQMEEIGTPLRTMQVEELLLNLKELREKGGPKLLEPIMAVEVVTPEEYLGSVIGDLNGRRGMIQGQDMRGNATVVNAFVPLANMFGYVNELRSFTQGRAQYSMQFSHYDEVPANVAQEVKEKLA